MFLAQVWLFLAPLPNSYLCPLFWSDSKISGRQHEPVILKRIRVRKLTTIFTELLAVRKMNKLDQKIC